MPGSLDVDIPNPSLNGCITAIKKRSWTKKLLTFAGIYKDMSLEEKFAYFHDFRHKIMLSNRIKVVPVGSGAYKAFIAKGNNGMLIKQALRKRWWWTLVDELEKEGDPPLNLIWTQRPKKFLFEQSPAGRECTNKFSCLQTKEKNKLKIIQEFQNLHGRILTQGDYQIIYTLQIEKLSSFFSVDQITNEIDTDKFLLVGKPNLTVIHNHFEAGNQLGDKISMCKNMRAFYEKEDKYIYDYLPLTFIVYTIHDVNFISFLEHFNDLERAKKESCDSFRNLWILKPGEDSNRGKGVIVMDKLTKIKD